MLDGDEYVITGHKVWTSYSDLAEWCLVLARTDHDVPKHKGISAFAVPMDQPGIEQRPLQMINGITREFGEVLFDGARVPAANMIGEPGDGWRLAMTVVSHEREPGELGYVSRYRKIVNQLVDEVKADPERFDAEQRRDLGWAIVESEMLRGPRLSPAVGSPRRHRPRPRGLDRQAPDDGGRAGRRTCRARDRRRRRTAARMTPGCRVYLYSRAQSVMGGTSQIQRNLVATRILGLPTS